jgi:lipoate-protein ligase A
MLLKDISFPSPEENILYDEVLLHLAEQGKMSDVMRFWESSRTFVVLGRVCKESEDVKSDAVRKDRVPVLRRASGGGTVLQGQGCLNYSLVLSKEHNAFVGDLHKSYQVILGRVITAFKRHNIEAMFCPISDIALAGSNKKISGNAQKRGRKFILHHGTILYDFDLAKIEKYLHVPKSIPEYRRKRSHLDFVANVPLSVTEIKSAFADAFGVDRTEKHLNGEEGECLRSFLDTKKVHVKMLSSK